MATPAFGINARVYRNTGSYATPVWLHVDIVSDLTYTRSPEVAEFYIRRSRVKYKVKTGLDFSISGTILAELGGTEYEVWDDAMDGDDVLDLLILNADINTVGARGIRADFQVAGADEGQGPTDVIMPSFTLNVYPAVNAPKKATVVTPGTPTYTDFGA
jgi:hypothetical protein